MENANKNIYTLQAELDVMAAILAHEMGSMSFMMPNIGIAEKSLYKAIEELTMQRIPAPIKEAMERENALRKAHVMLLEVGFHTWDLCNLRMKHKKS